MPLNMVTSYNIICKQSSWRTIETNYSQSTQKPHVINVRFLQRSHTEERNLNFKIHVDIDKRREFIDLQKDAIFKVQPFANLIE